MIGGFQVKYKGFEKHCKNHANPSRRSSHVRREEDSCGNPEKNPTKPYVSAKKNHYLDLPAQLLFVIDKQFPAHPWCTLAHHVVPWERSVTSSLNLCCSCRW